MTIREGVRSLALIAAGVWVAWGPLSAATVEVTVLERGGGPVPDQPVALYPVTPAMQTDSLYFMNSRPAGRCTTGDTGRCSISDLPVGVYVPFLWGIVDPNLAAPIGPPMVAYGTVTVLKAGAQATLKIGLRRGVRVQFRIVSDRAPIPPRSGVELASDSGETTNAAFDGGGAAKITLGSGRWVAHLAGPPGARIVGVELDGKDLATLDVPIELVAPSSDRFVTWTLSAPCTIRGRVTSTRTPTGVGLGATLVTPGRWAASPLCRATNCAGAPSASVGPTGNYALEVPSGSWRIAPTGDSLLESTPPSIDVTCGEGESARADFQVKERDGETPKVVLSVAVFGPDRGRPLLNVPVEAWPATGNLDASAPVATASTGAHFEGARFTSLPAGSYLVRARKPGYRTGVVAVSGVDPDAPEARSIMIVLDKGATIDALVTDTKGVPQTGVGLEVKPNVSEGENQDPVARLGATVEDILVPPSNDQTGHVLVTGLSGGTYTVRPVPSGAIAAGVVATIGAGEKELIVRLAEHDVREVDVRLLPAASLAGRLVCTDAGLLPRQGDACVLGMPAPEEDDVVREACAKPVISPGTIEFSGERRDSFRVGPLTPGTYRLGLRPRGYSSWTWALGTPDGAQAAVVAINGNDPADLGTIPVFCGPAVTLRPTVLSHDPPPDLTLARVEAELTRKVADGTVERRGLSAEKDRDRVTLRELPEGEWTLEVTISHPFFMPPAPVRLSVPVKLERGRLVGATVEIAAVGGAIVVDAPAGAARVIGPDGTARVVPAKSGAIVIEGVAPAIYRVELCEDPSCARAARRWEGVKVTRGQKAVLRTAP